MKGVRLISAVIKRGRRRVRWCSALCNARRESRRLLGVRWYSALLDARHDPRRLLLPLTAGNLLLNHATGITRTLAHLFYQLEGFQEEGSHEQQEQNNVVRVQGKDQEEKPMVGMHNRLAPGRQGYIESS